MSYSNIYLVRNQKALPEALRMTDLTRFEGQAVLVKLHMGEPGNPYFISPELARLVINEVSSAGGRPFLFDTVVAYPGERSHRRGYERVARRHGFYRDNVGCNITIGERGIRILEGDIAIEVATQIYETDCMVVLSHVKGHIQAGFGGAIKNLGMGGVTKASKRRIHCMSMPIHDNDTCNYCGKCVSACPYSALSISNDWFIDRTKCEGCGKCVLACTQHALRFETMSLAEGLAISAMACTRNKEVVYLSSLHHITQNCDCEASPGPIMCPDIGYLVGTDAAAIDAAALDLIDDVAPGVCVRYTGVDPREQITHAAALGMRDTYRLSEL